MKEIVVDILGTPEFNLARRVARASSPSTSRFTRAETVSKNMGMRGKTMWVFLAVDSTPSFTLGVIELPLRLLAIFVRGDNARKRWSQEMATKTENSTFLVL